MKVNLPENQSEIKLGQYQEFVKLTKRKDLDAFEFSKRKVKIFTGLSYNLVNMMNLSDLEEMIRQIDSALEEEVEFKQRFEMRGVKFGFIPNFDDIKAKEYFDLSTYETEVETLHKLMSILFRPIKRESLGNYQLVSYNGSDEWSEVMKLMPLNIVNGALVFFCSLAMELERHILKSTTPERKRKAQQTILKNGVGTQQSTDSQRERFGGMNTSKR